MGQATEGIPSRLPIWITWLAFLVGLTGSLSLRLILIARKYDPELVRLFWYIGVIGNMFFFLFRSYISARRRKIIASLALQEKLKNKAELNSDDYKALSYLISSLYVSKERWNYAIISFFSLLAVLWDIFM